MLYLTFNSLGSKTRFGQVINGNEIHGSPPDLILPVVPTCLISYPA